MNIENSPDRRDMPEEKENKQKQSLRKKAESKIRSKLRQDRGELTHDDALNLVNELQVHQVELEIQNGELKKTYEELSRARDRYADLYDFAPVGYLTLSKYNIIKEANITVCRMLGVKRADLLNRRFTTYIAPESQDEFYLHRHDVIKSGTGQSCEVIIKCHEGGSFWAGIDMVPYDVGVRIAVTDISQRKNAEKQLARQTDTLNTIMENTDAMLVYFDRDFNFIIANKAYLDGCGHSWEELKGKNHFSFFPNEENEAIFRRVRETGETVTFFDKPFEYATQPWRGVTYWNWTLAPVKNDAGYVTGLVLSLIETTQRVRSEKALKQSEEQFRRAIEEAPIPVIMHAENGEVLQISRSWTELTGYTHEDMRNFDVWLNQACGEGAEKLREHVRKLFYGDTASINLELPIRTKDNRVRYWSFSASSPGTLSSGQCFIVGMAEDITERKRAEQMKDEFLSLVSHELRTPLTVIGGSLKVALDERASREEARELIQNAAENTDILADLLENMLELTRHQTGRLQINAGIVDMHQLVNNAIDKVKGYGAAQEIHVEIPDNLPEIQADPTRVGRIIRNLLDNAVKYSPGESSINIRVYKDDTFLVTSVTDQGVGISGEDKKNLFQLFSRVGNTAATTGIGLGLVVCQRLLEAHGGWIRVESEPGKGSTFAFGLPLNSEH
jgi:PAS domain S-box-containing protein